MVWFWCVSLFLSTSVCFTVYHFVLLGDICGEKESVCNLILWLVTFFNLIEWRFAFCVLKNSLWKICVCDVDSTSPLTVSGYLFRCSRISVNFFSSAMVIQFSECLYFDGISALSFSLSSINLMTFTFQTDLLNI